MTVSLATIYDNVLKDLGLNSSDSTWQGRATRWINKALDKITMVCPNAEFLQNSYVSINTVADQPTYSMPSDFFELLSLRDDDNKTDIEILTHGEFDRRHLDPSGEDTNPPIHCTLEFDTSSGVAVMRLAPIPDDAYTLYATMRTFHPTLSGSQVLVWDKLQTALEDQAIYEGSLVVFPDAEFANYRLELKERGGESIRLVAGLLNSQKPAPARIPTVLKRP
jgi:hypothetical protein